MHDPRLRTGVRLEGGERRAFQGPAGPPRPVLSVAVEQRRRWWFLVTEDPFPRLLSPAVMKQLLHPSFRERVFFFLSFYSQPRSGEKEKRAIKSGTGGLFPPFRSFLPGRNACSSFLFPYECCAGRKEDP